MDKETPKHLGMPGQQGSFCNMDAEAQELVCKASGLAYPIRDGIPVMLETEARQLDSEEKFK